MFARKVSLKLRANSAVEFSRLLDTKVIPLLREQKGFRDEISFVSGERGEAVAISLWEGREHADAYHKQVYPEVLKSLEHLFDGTPRVSTFALGNSTVHKISNPPA
ncbi:MAG TPA: hypothetical protein VJO34_02065 [Methylomirabilota bacterium]|nr:hypothetical protein [Methylomirabilota bacterium]